VPSIWANVARASSGWGIEDDFFALGGPFAILADPRVVAQVRTDLARSICRCTASFHLADGSRHSRAEIVALMGEARGEDEDAKLVAQLGRPVRRGRPSGSSAELTQGEEASRLSRGSSLDNQQTGIVSGSCATSRFSAGGACFLPRSDHAGGVPAVQRPRDLVTGLPTSLEGRVACSVLWTACFVARPRDPSDVDQASTNGVPRPGGCPLPGRVELTVVDLRGEDGRARPGRGDPGRCRVAVPFDLSRDPASPCSARPMSPMTRDLLLVVNHPHRLRPWLEPRYSVCRGSTSCYCAFPRWAGSRSFQSCRSSTAELRRFGSGERVGGGRAAGRASSPYWKDQLARRAPRGVLELPADRPASGEPELSAGALYDFAFAPELANSLRALAREAEGRSLFMVARSGVSRRSSTVTPEQTTSSSARRISGRPPTRSSSRWFGFFSNHACSSHTGPLGRPDVPAELVGACEGEQASRRRPIRSFRSRKLVEALNPEADDELLAALPGIARLRP